MRRIVPLLLAGLLLVPLASAHAAPPPRDFETRILHDHNDDSAVVLAGKHGFDAIALDARSVTLPDGSDGVALRLLLNGGCNDDLPDQCPTLSHVITFMEGEAERSVTLSSDDGGATFTTDAQHIVQPVLINDGTRFAVEAWTTYSGDTLSEWFVEGYSGEAEGDNMPQGAAPGTPDPLGAAFDIGEFAAPELDYLSVVLDKVEAEVQSGGEASFTATVTNLLGATQNVSLALDGAPLSTTLSLSPNATKTVDFVIKSQTTRNTTLVATTPLGGYAAATAAVKVRDPLAHEEHPEDLAFTSPEIPQGSSWSHTFHTVGIFAYHDHKRPNVQGAITIMAAADNHTPEEHEVRFVDGAFDPAEFMIHTSDTVTWYADDGAIMVMGGVTPDGSDPLGHDHGDHGDHDGHGNDGSDDESIPGPAPGLIAITLAGLAAWRRH